MIKRNVLLFMLLGLFAGKAHAITEVVEVNRSSATVGRVTCSTGTTTRMDTAVYDGLFGTGLNRTGVRITNQDSADDVFIGFDTNVSSAVTSAKLGERIQAGQDAPYAFGRDIQFWCIAADAAGAAGAITSFLQQGYK